MAVPLCERLAALLETGIEPTETVRGHLRVIEAQIVRAEAKIDAQRAA